LAVIQNPAALRLQPLACISSVVRQRRSTPKRPVRCLSNVLTRLKNSPHAVHWQRFPESLMLRSSSLWLLDLTVRDLARPVPEPAGVERPPRVRLGLLGLFGGHSAISQIIRLGDFSHVRMYPVGVGASENS